MAAAVVSASSLLFAVRVRNKPDERGTLLIHHLGHSSFLKVFLSGGLRDSHLLSADSVHSSLFPHCRCFKRRFPPPRCRRPSPMSMAASASTASQVASFVSLSVCRWREKGERTTRNCEMRREGRRRARRERGGGWDAKHTCTFLPPRSFLARSVDLVQRRS